MILIELYKGKKEELDALSSIFKYNISLYYNSCYDWFKRIEPILTKGKHRTCLVIKHNNEIIGTLICKVSNVRKRVKISTLFIKEEYRRKGYGSELLKTFYNLFPYYSIDIRTKSSNTVAFLVKRGYGKIKIKNSEYCLTKIL